MGGAALVRARGGVMRLGVVLVHGIGDQGPDWADAIISTLAGRVLEDVQRLGLTVSGPDEMMAFGRVHWAAVLQARQRVLAGVLRKALEAPGARGSWLTRAWEALWRRLRRGEPQFIAEFIGDVIGYREPAARAQIYEAVRETLEGVASTAAAGSDRTPLTLIAHSLGTVISSDFVWDAAKARLAQGAPGFHDRLRLENFFTVGSPIALFSLQYGGPEVFNQPIRMETPAGRWINFFDRDDPIGMPLRPLNTAYQAAVAHDVPVEAGPYLRAHERYFTRSDTLAIISRKLALDWAAHNQRLVPSRLATLYAAYDLRLAAGHLGRLR